MEGGGFEPPKSLTTDLQSVPFGHSGTLPYWSWWLESNPQPADYKSAALPVELHQPINLWCLGAESNHRHRDFQSLALPTELQSHIKLAVSTGIEPAIFCVTGRRVNQLHQGTLTNWLREMDLNQRPSGYEPDELPNCSIPRYKWRRRRDSNPCAACTTSRFSRPVPSTRLGYFSAWCLRPDLNRHEGWFSQDFKSCASTNSATQAQNGDLYEIRTHDPLIKSQMLYQLS